MSSWSSKMKGMLAALTALVALVVILVFTPWVTCEEDAEAAREDASATRAEQAHLERQALQRESDRREAERDARFAELDAEAAARRAAWDAEVAAKAPPPRQRSIRRFQWESPAEARGKLWNVPEEDSEEAVLTAFLRVCIAEADGHVQDCVGIWQVVKNNRRRTCDRGTIRRITECDEDGETMLSALRRHQRHVLGFMKARHRRVVWIGNLTPDCEVPDGWSHGESRWDALYGSKVCPQVVADTRRLMKGELPLSRPGARVSWLPDRPITWGGRCESGRGACDDRLACARGLVRIGAAGTLNAFWRRSRGPDDVEPVCLELGYARPAGVDSPHDTDRRAHPRGQEVSDPSPSADMGADEDDLRRQEEHVAQDASS